MNDDRVLPADGGVPGEILLARAFLSRICEPACIPLWDLVRTNGPIEAVERLRRGSVPDRLASLVASRLDRVDAAADLAAAARHGIRLITPESDEWPHFALSALERTGETRLETYRDGVTTHSDSGELIPPLALWIRGTLDLASVGVRSVGLVGSRTATSYGERVASDLGWGLAKRDFVVVSGGAYGIDGAAHRGALAAGGATVIVSAGGVDRAYPPSHDRLFEQAAVDGLVLSESPPGCAPRRGRFLTRNRLIAALSTGTVVIEASRRSGARNTASHAAKLQRPLMAVPGPVTSAMSVGCHQLLRADEGRAALVTGVDDIVELIGTSSDPTSASTTADPAATEGVGGGHPRGRAAADLQAELDRLDPSSARVYDGLPARRTIGIDDLAASSAQPIPTVLAALATLELAGLVEQDDGGFRRRRARSRSRVVP